MLCTRDRCFDLIRKNLYGQNKYFCVICENKCSCKANYYVNLLKLDYFTAILSANVKSKINLNLL